MSELDWSDEDLLLTAAAIIDAEEKSITHQVDMYHDYRMDFKFIGGMSVALFSGSLLMSKLNAEGWLELPQQVSVIGFAGLGVLSLGTSVSSAFRARQIRAELIE